MGSIYADEEEHPKSAMAILGDFCFFSGEVKKELIAYKPECCENDFMIMVPGTEDNALWKTGPWMRKFGIIDHWVRGPVICALLSLICAGIGMLIR